MAEPEFKHHFETGTEQLTLIIELPGISSLQDVQLDIGKEEVRLQLPDQRQPFGISLPRPCSLTGDAEAKFSRKRGQLTIKWPVAAETSEEPPLLAPQPATPQPPQPATTQHQETSNAAYGSLWNKNSWHWEEKNCLDLAKAEVCKALVSSNDLKHVRNLSGSSIVIKDLEVQGDASFALRRGKRFLCYELSASFKWEGRDEFGGPLGVKGSGKVDSITPDETEEPIVDIEVSTSFGGGAEAKAAGAWMRGEGAKAIGRAVSADVLQPAIMAAESLQADPQADKARRKAEEAKAEAARMAAAEVQQQIAAEQRQKEAEKRAERPSVAKGEIAGSVWNVNAWHWEEKPMTEWSRNWLCKELAIKAQLLSGLAEGAISDVKVSGDASVSVRKGKPIVLFLLSIECEFEISSSTQGLGEARGNLTLPEFSSEEGAGASVIKVEVTKDSSRGRLGSAFRKDGISAVREVLRRYEEALRKKLPTS